MFILKTLRTEYRENPLGIATASPRFSWTYAADTDEGQTAYRLTVTCRGQQVWDSGRVESKENVNVVYGGAALKSAEVYLVKLETYSKNSSSGISGTFETALFSKDDWKGHWTGTNAVFTDTITVLRKDITIENKPVVRARMYLLGIGYHYLYINGEKVGDEFLAPSNSDYTKTLYYKTYDITKYLRAGVNAVAVELGYGWFGKKSVLLEMFAEYADGTRFTDNSYLDGAWRVGRGPVTRNNVFGGETYDGTLAEKIGDYRHAGYDAEWNNGWMFAFRQLPETGRLLADQTDPIRITAEYKPVKITKINDEYVYDFGQNMAGWVELKAKGERGAKISMRFAEDLNEDGTVNQLNLRTADSLDEFILGGGGEQTFEPRFTYHGFRYMQLKTEGRAEVISAVAKHVHNDVPVTGGFECSDGVLNTLHKNAAMTELNNLHSLMTDCPQRDERLCWLNDISSRIFQSINNFDLSRMIPKILNDIRDTQDENGAIADTAPFIGGTRPADPICASYILLGRFAYRYYGDKRVLSEFYDSYKKWIDCLMTYQENYIIGLSYYGDWVIPECYGDTRTSSEYMSTVYLYWQLKLMAEIAHILGKTDDEAEFAKMSAESAAAINARYLDPKTANYDNGSQTANSLSLSLGFAPRELRAKILENIVNDVLARGKHNTSGNQGYRHFFYTLAEAGYTQLAIDVLKNPEYPGWGYMVAQGATTVWERWEKTMQMEMHSFDHPMFASYDGIFYHYLAGICVDADACGCNKLTIRPDWHNNLTYARAHLDTVRGRVECGWQKEGNKVRVEIQIPPTASATIAFDGTMNGTPVTKGTVVGGGKYTITAEV